MVQSVANGAAVAVPTSSGSRKPQAVIINIRTWPPDCIWMVWVPPAMGPICANGVAVAAPTNSGRNNNPTVSLGLGLNFIKMYG